MTYELASALLLAEMLTPTTLGEALLLAAREGVSFTRALLTLRAIDPARLDKVLGRGDLAAPVPVVPVQNLMGRLPEGLCARLMALPVRVDDRTGTVDVAVADARDPHAPEEISYHLDAAVRAVRAPVWAIQAALGHGSRLPSEAPATSRESHAEEHPLSRRTLVQFYAREVPESLDHAHEAAENLREAVERAVQDAEGELPRTTLVPASLAVPPPPNTERKPTVPSVAPAPPSEASTSANLPLADIGAVLSAIRAAKTRDELLDLVLQGARTVARRVAIFAVRREEFVGWSCTPEFAPVEDLRAIALSMHAPSVLMLGAVAGGYLGPITASDVHEPLLRVMGSPTGDVAVAAVRVLRRPAAIILADELGYDALLATRRLDEVARAAGDQLANIVRDRR